MRQSLYRFFIELTNGRFTSFLLKRFSQSRLSAAIIPSYARVFNIQQEEMEKGLKSYRTLHDLFTRKLKEGVRPIDGSEDAVICPVDGVLEDYGPISESKEFVVKGKTYSIEEMLGSHENAVPYIGGTYIILYLSPSHYHRIHSPIAGKVLQRFVLGRKSYPVNQLGLKFGKEPLSKNYRVVTEMEHDSKRMMLVKVGAMFVNSIEVTNQNEQVNKGEEIAYFTFGSTVILLFQKGAFQPAASLRKRTGVRVGQQLGTWN
ncbi:phosphatidylserine decarboxylase [Bacillus sp. 165]|uniref:phosphatidylserine decarboxylase n=1 Tax=Bacillus sp. 165 TaxID=1529117 RepID=UPI001ADB44EA|nr:phosphatidylserine decarboxylase [Bacillus sp. 165]MBO9129564.1 phosphatidylserine decarboxylase [Bacillus sp. 165]